MTPRPKNTMPVDCLLSLHPKVQPKSTFTILLFFEAFTYVHPYRRIHDSDDIIDVDDNESDQESADGNTPQRIRKRQEIYDKAM
jgi:hypothetical protein